MGETCLNTDLFHHYPCGVRANAQTLAHVSDYIHQQYVRAERAHTYIIAIAGSVAAGKSTLSTTLKALIERWPGQPRVDIVSTDGFLYPNAELEQRHLMHRKGFPESYRTEALKQFLLDVSQGEPALAVPVYSQVVKDVINDPPHWIEQPDVLILEGLNILQLDARPDFSIYLDADAEDIQRWYSERFTRLSTAPAEQAQARADRLWREVNLKNLEENILVTRSRAHMVLHKTGDHSIDQVWLRHGTPLPGTDDAFRMTEPGND